MRLSLDYLDFNCMSVCYSLIMCMQEGLTKYILVSCRYCLVLHSKWKEILLCDKNNAVEVLLWVYFLAFILYTIAKPENIKSVNN